MNKTCATCHWLAAYMTHDPSHGGECVRHAPDVVVVHDTVVTIRPTVLATDRCGEWEPKDKAALAAYLMSKET